MERMYISVQSKEGIMEHCVSGTELVHSEVRIHLRGFANRSWSNALLFFFVGTLIHVREGS